MLAEAEKVEFMDNCSKLQSLSPTHLPELIKCFDSKINQHKDVSQVKSAGGTPKMKLRDAREVLEIARLKVLVSEMREKVAKMEAQLRSEAQRHDNGSAKSQDENLKKKKKNYKDLQELWDAKNINKDNFQDFNKNNKLDSQEVARTHADLRDFMEISKDLCMEEQRDNVDIGLADVKCDSARANVPNDDVSNNKDLQVFAKNCKNVLEQQHKDAEVLHVHIANLQYDVDKMLLELSGKPALQKELDISKETIKGLQEEIKDDAGITKAQLLLLKQHFGELEEMKTANECKELQFHKALQISSALEAEVAQLKSGNIELLKRKQELREKLGSVLKKAEKITPVAKDDVLASQAEVSNLRSTNMELQRTVESLQISRFNEVEELVYLRWVNACLRHDLDTYKASRTNSEDISNQSKKCSPSLHGKDEGDPMSRTNSGRSFESYGNTHDYSVSQNDDEGISPSYEGSTKSSPKMAIRHGRVSSTHSSPIAITHAHGNSMHTSPLAVMHARVNSTQTSPLSTIMHAHQNNSHTSHSTIMHGPVNASHTSPRYPHQSTTKTKSGPVIATRQHSPSNYSLSQPPEAYNPCQVSPGKTALQSDPRRISEIQSRLSFNDGSAKSDTILYMTNFTSDSPIRRSGRSFNRSASNVSSSSEASINRTQSSPQKQDMRRFMRSSSTLSSDSDISSTSQGTNTSSLRQHSASSEGADLSKRRDHTNVRAHSFARQLNASDRVVAAFQVLSASTHTNDTHRTFKDLSRWNSHDEKAASKVKDQVTDEHQSSDSAHMPSANSTQADFFCDLARAIQATHYKSIEKVAAFVNWFDRQGDEEKREFFNFPDCPKDKMEAMRRGVYEYEELQALETELKSYQDDVKSPADLALQEMKNLLEKAENHIQGFKQAREVAVAQFTELDIPTHWMLDSEMIAKIKRASLQLAQKYMKRVTTILSALGDHQTESRKVSRESMLPQVAKFVLQVHNFAGGFDKNTANAFKELQSQAYIHESDVA